MQGERTSVPISLFDNSADLLARRREPKYPREWMLGDQTSNPFGFDDNALSEALGLPATFVSSFKLKGLILAQNERWRRGLGMQVERERGLRLLSRVAKG